MKKSRFIAAALALFAGSFGIHRFYLKQPELGFFYLMMYFFSMSFFGIPISTVLGLWDALRLFMMSDDEFNKKYNSPYYRDRYGRRRKRVRDVHNRRGKYILMDEDESTTKKNRDNYFTLIKNKKESKSLKQAGIKLFKDYDFKGAEKKFLMALEKNPNDLAILFNLACTYSLMERLEDSIQYLDLAVAKGFKGVEQIKTHESLAYVRVTEAFEAFEKNGFRINSEVRRLYSTKKVKNEEIFDKLGQLKVLRTRGMITEKKYLEETEKLKRRS